jgi:glycosyltransferase involved in cell wall biosynthesis
MDPMSLPLSIIIPTYMRNQVLWKSILDLKPQIREDDEVLVIDQNIPPLHPPPELDLAWLKLIHLDQPSLTRARNRGIQAALHEHLVFLDDDIIPNPQLLEKFRQAAKKNPGCIVTGLVDQEDKPDNLASPGYIDLSTGEIRTNFSQPVVGDMPFFPGCLSLIPKTCLPPPPYFCPAFRGASQGEEIDFALRVRAQGKRIVADPEIIIFHLKVVEGGCRSAEFKQRFFLDHIFNQGLFFGRHGQLLSLPACLKRLKGFVEFHTRINGGKTHSGLLILTALSRLTSGLLMGIRQRIF